ncbi:hypothetical protein R80B4_02417 [Fibrobacteres bacterium R8-0-B4]
MPLCPYTAELPVISKVPLSLTITPEPSDILALPSIFKAPVQMTTRPPLKLTLSPKVSSIYCVFTGVDCTAPNSSDI